MNPVTDHVNRQNLDSDRLDRRSPDSDRMDRKTLVCSFGPSEPKDFSTRSLGPFNRVTAKGAQQQLGAL